jgi:hypothetical protein
MRGFGGFSVRGEFAVGQLKNICGTKETAISRFLTILPHPSNNMKKSLALLSAVLLSAFVQISQADDINTLNINLSSANGGSQTAISWLFGGSILTSATAGGSVRDTGMSTIGAFKDTFASPATYTFSNAGTFTNLTTSVTKQIQFVAFRRFGSNDVVGLGWDLTPPPSPLSTLGNSIKYIPGVDSYVIDQSFDEFNPGVYFYTNNETTIPGLQVTLTIDAVPEPSTYALLLLSGAASLWALKRRKS